MERKRKICVINGKRGGFNALLPTMRAISEHPKLELQVILTDMHLSQTFGHTLDYAKRFIDISKTVPIDQTGSSPRERGEALGRALTGLSGALSELAPDMVLILGDRSETLIAAFAALQLKIPIAHIQGGEVSGNIDGIQRHAITKLAHLHFTETELARKRVLALGEDPWRVFNSGAPYIDFIKLGLYTEENILRERYKLPKGEPFLLVLQHPVTTEPEKSYTHMREVLRAVAETNLRALVVYPCSDQGYQGIIDAIEEVRPNQKISIYKNIPAEDFIGLQAIAGALIGNSSAGVYEAPYLNCPFINVGRRQIKRERERNSIDVPPTATAVKSAVDRALKDKIFLKRLQKKDFIYGDGLAYKRITNVLASVELTKNFFEKRLTYYSWKRRLYDNYMRPIIRRFSKD